VGQGMMARRDESRQIIATRPPRIIMPIKRLENDNILVPQNASLRRSVRFRRQESIASIISPNPKSALFFRRITTDGNAKIIFSLTPYYPKIAKKIHGFSKACFDLEKLVRGKEQRAWRRVQSARSRAQRA
jgi:hypothetical protein